MSTIRSVKQLKLGSLKISYESHFCLKEILFPIRNQIFYQILANQGDLVFSSGILSHSIMLKKQRGSLHSSYICNVLKLLGHPSTIHFLSPKRLVCSFKTCLRRHVAGQLKFIYFFFSLLFRNKWNKWIRQCSYFSIPPYFLLT